MKVYISGPISGQPIETAKANFKEVENTLTEMGHETVNPFNVLEYHPDLTWSDYMKADIIAMLDCDAICMMKGFPTSKGAMVEFNLAVELGLKVFHHNE